jgi:hypothetical protein
MNLNLIPGGYPTVKPLVLTYCFEQFENYQIWIVDSLQVFDPYAVSRVSTAKARLMLKEIKIARPFTFYQMKEKIFTLTKLSLDKNSVVIITGLDAFEQEIPEDEFNAHLRHIASVIRKLLRQDVNVIIGIKDSSLRQSFKRNFREVVLWEAKSI